jgi:hypothetical protein
VIVAARLETTTQLWDFMVDSATLCVEALLISKQSCEQGAAASTVGTPSIVAGANGLHIFARSDDDRLLEYFSLDGREWRFTDISTSTSMIGGDPGAVLLQNGTPVVCAADKQGNLLQFSTLPGTVGDSSSNWRVTQLSDCQNVFQRRPVPVLSTSGFSVFDLKIAV